MKKLILILALTCLACMLQTAPAAVVDVEVQPSPTPEIITRPDMLSPEPTPEARTFVVVAATLYIRDRDGEVVGYLHQNDLVICQPAGSGWCIMDKGQRIWAGCLDPAPQDLGCEAK